MKKWSLVLCLILSTGCVSTSVREEQERVRFQETLDLSQLTNAQKLLDGGQFESALVSFKEFSSAKPTSKYWLRAKFGEADALEGLSRHNESIQLLRELRDLTLRENPAGSAMASYKLSFVYENIGDDSKTLASLLESYSKLDLLPDEVAYAEVPARLAVAYSKLGKTDEAMNWLARADRGLKKSIEILGYDRSWIARTYFYMGKVSTEQLGHDNFMTTIEAQRIVQVYHLKGLHVGDPIWSLKSKQALMDSYQALLNQLRQMKYETREESELRTKAGGALISLLKDAELYAPIEDEKRTDLEKEFFSYLKKVQDVVRVVAFKSETNMDMTEAAKERNSLRKNFNLEEPEGYVPRVAPNSEDPNI